MHLKAAWAGAGAERGGPPTCRRNTAAGGVENRRADRRASASTPPARVREDAPVRTRVTVAAGATATVASLAMLAPAGRCSVPVYLWVVPFVTAFVAGALAHRRRPGPGTARLLAFGALAMLWFAVGLAVLLLRDAGRADARAQHPRPDARPGDGDGADGDDRRVSGRARRRDADARTVGGSGRRSPADPGRGRRHPCLDRRVGRRERPVPRAGHGRSRLAGAGRRRLPRCGPGRAARRSASRSWRVDIAASARSAGCR